MMSHVYQWMLLALLLTGSCKRRPLEDESAVTARIPVKIDWSESNIPVSEDDPSGGGYVHRVSLRFYPEDGSPVFEQYLEGNIFEGEVLVPVGRYKVIVMNESAEDTSYWEDAIVFSDVDSFSDFAATIRPMSPAFIAQNYPFYTPAPGENMIVEPFHLASWSLGEFEVTDEMIRVSRSPSRGGRAAVDGMLEQLTRIKMRALTRDVDVTAHIKNLISAQPIYTVAKGFAGKVYMASGQTADVPSSYLFKLNGRVMDPNGKDGTTHKSFLSFGRVPAGSDESYWIGMDIMLTDGTLYTPAVPLMFDVTGQVPESVNLRIELRIPPGEGQIELPYIDGGIYVGDWDDEIIDIM